MASTTVKFWQSEQDFPMNEPSFTSWNSRVRLIKKFGREILTNGELIQLWKVKFRRLKFLFFDISKAFSLHASSTNIVETSAMVFNAHFTDIEISNHDPETLNNMDLNKVSIGMVQ